MFNLFRSLICSIFVVTTVFFSVVSAQDEEVVVSSVASVASSDRVKTDDDDKGSIVRGRAFYQNTTSPVRRGWIGLVKIRELVEKRADDTKEGVAVAVGGYGGSRESDNYVLTNDEGEFVMKGVKAGIYQPTFKVQGILNPTSADRENPIYPLITVDGINEVNAQIPARRGGSVSGRISYYDGEPVIGAKVIAVMKKESESNNRYEYGSESKTVDITDDRGFYHFAGLPADEYFVRVIESSVHNESNNLIQGYNTMDYTTNSILVTFYPSVSKIEEARLISVSPEQEQSDINITIPNRRLFKISGIVITKSNKNPIKDLQVTFQKSNDNKQFFDYSHQSKQVKTDEQGKWSFIDLPKGKYLVKVSHADTYRYTSKTQKLENQPKFAPLTKEIEIDNDNLQDIIFELSGEAAISGTVTVEGGKGFPKFLFLSAFDEQIKINSSTAVNGSENADKSQPNKTRQPFRIGELAAGKYKLSVNTIPSPN